MNNQEEFDKNQEKMSKMNLDDLKSALNNKSNIDDLMKQKPSDYINSFGNIDEIKKPDLESEIVSNKQLRKDIDEITQKVSSLPKSRERALSITKLEEATMWLGMDLKRLGTPNPYPNSKSPKTGSIIDPTADGLKFSGNK